MGGVYRSYYTNTRRRLAATPVRCSNTVGNVVSGDAYCDEQVFQCQNRRKRNVCGSGFNLV